MDNIQFAQDIAKFTKENNLKEYIIITRLNEHQFSIHRPDGLTNEMKTLYIIANAFLETNAGLTATIYIPEK